MAVIEEHAQSEKPRKRKQTAATTATATGDEDLDTHNFDPAEEEFDLEIPDEAAEKLRTVGDVVVYLQSKGKA